MIPVATPPERPASSSVKDVRAPEPGAVLTQVDGEEDMPLPANPQTFFLGGLFVLAGLAALYVASAIILPVVLAFVLMLLLQPAVRGPRARASAAGARRDPCARACNWDARRACRRLVGARRDMGREVATWHTAARGACGRFEAPN